jgi:FixJ family two-component response regulator
MKEPGTDGAPAKVHLVDDEPIVLAALARLLRLHGFEVVTHGSAQAFLDSYDREEPGCVVVDVTMPGIDGLQLQARLQQQDGPPVIFLSGLATVPRPAEAMRQGVVDFLEKPVDEARLVAALQAALERDAQSRSGRKE